MIKDDVHRMVTSRFLSGDGSDVLTSSTDLLASGICDSLGLVELATEIEARFTGVRVDDQEITCENLGSVDRIVSFLNSKGIS